MPTTTKADADGDLLRTYSRKREPAGTEDWERKRGMREVEYGEGESADDAIPAWARSRGMRKGTKYETEEDREFYKRQAQKRGLQEASY